MDTIHTPGGPQPACHIRSRRAIFTPAMAAGVTSKLWEMSDMVKVLEDWENSEINEAR
jgi:hypothetical protein